MKRSTLKAAVLILLTFISLITIGYTGNYLTRTTGLRSLFPSFGGDIIGDAEAGKKTGVELPVAIEELNAPVRVDNSIEVLAIPTSAFRVSLGRARLSGPAGSLGENTMLSVNALKEDELPPLEMGMVNVTGTHAAFRMLPHGILFNNDIDIVLPYDKSLLPMGFTENDIRTYYYDEHYGSWIMIELDSVDISNGVVVSRVNHFTDFINAVMKAPEMPETNAYVPTTMSDIQAGNPMESLTLIQPPSANNSGSANLSYPIDIPAGRNGMQPNLNITYNSGGGSGWLGLGWDLNIPMVTIDTRWGVPRYEPDKESETYLLNGEQLVTKDEEGNFNPLTHRAEWQPRMTGDVQFYPRVEGAFNKIIRHGDTPREYWWEVIDKNGTRYFYGKKLGEDVVDPQAVLTDMDGRIGKWGLTEVRDLNDNFVYYTYNNNNSLIPVNIYYTGNGTTKGKYGIHFISKPKLFDLTNSARLGFKEENPYVLNDIKISFNGEYFKQYKFCYKQGGFGKSLLHKISEVLPEYMNGINEFECDCNSGTGLLITHILEYYEKPESTFGPVITIDTGLDPDADARVSPINIELPTSLGGTATRSWDLGGGLTMGTGFLPNKAMTGGGNYVNSQSRSQGVVTLIDMDGDGLPDKLFRKRNGGLFYRKQIIEDGVSSFSDPIQLRGLDENLFSKERSSTNNIGGEGHLGAASVGVTKSKNKSRTKSSTEIYMTDLNADGLPDIIQNGYVFFNHLIDGVPFFNDSLVAVDPEGGTCKDVGMGSSFNGTNQLISTGEGLRRDLFTTDRYVLSPYYDIKNGLMYDTVYIEEEEKLYPSHELVKMWIAPYNGVVSIKGNATLSENLMQSRIYNEIMDGVHIIIEKSDYSESLYSAHLNTENIRAEPNLVNINVRKGERIYFRIQSLEDKRFDILHWIPEITYTSINGSTSGIDPHLTDADNRKIYVFNSSDDFLINPVRYYNLPLSGEVKIKGVFEITGGLSSNVKFAIYHNNSVIEDFNILKGNTELRTVNLDAAVNAGDSIWFEVISSTNVNWQSVRFNGQLFYTSCNDTAIPAMNNYFGEPRSNIIFDVIPHLTAYPKPVLPTRIYNVRNNTTFNSLTLNILNASGSGRYTLSIKDDNGTVVEGIVVTPNGTSTVEFDRSYTLIKDRIYYFDLYSADNEICDNITDAYCIINGNRYDFGLHTVHEGKDAIFGSLFNNWGQFNYLNLSEDNTALINESLLGFSDYLIENLDSAELLMDYNFDDEVFHMLDPDYENNRWVGYRYMSYVTADTLSNTYPRFIKNTFLGDEDNLFDMEAMEHSPFPAHPKENVKVVAPIKMSRSENTTDAGGVRISFGQVGETENKGFSKVTLDFMDMNGDRYPDVITEYEINYSQPQGGLARQTIGHNIDKSGSDTKKFNGTGSNFGATASNAKESSTGPSTKVRQMESIGNAGLGIGTNKSNSQFTWIDINGDGLPDKVTDEGKVYLNLGYAYMKEETERSMLNSDYSKSVGVSVSTGELFNIFGTSFSGGLGGSISTNTTNSIFMDINGDGLPDMLFLDNWSSDNSTIKIRYNSGSRFLQEETLIEDADLFLTRTISGNINGSVTLGAIIPIPLPFPPFMIGIKIMGNPKGGGSWSLNKIQNQLIDINGDGLPDYVTSGTINHLYVKYNQTGKTNLLKSVKNIANGKIDIDYELSENSFESPNRKWTMSSLKIFDGKTGDGIDTLFYTFKYSGARYQRYEREDYGFRHVVTEQRDTSGNIYRITSELFHNDEKLRKGLKSSETLIDPLNRLRTEKIYNYSLNDIETGEIITTTDFCNIGYPALHEEIVKYFENDMIITKKVYEYGPYGNVIRYSNLGDLSTDSDDLKTEIRYHQGIHSNMVGIPSEIIVEDRNNNILRKKSMDIDDKGNITAFTQYNGTEESTTTYTYDIYGNITNIKKPHNDHNHQMTYKYTYDNEVHTYPVEIMDVFGLYSTATYDYRWGKPLRTIGTSLARIIYTYDWRGRLSKVLYDGESDYSILFHYWLDEDAYPIGSRQENIPWSVTYKKDGFNPGNPLTTVLFCDATGRILQSKKDFDYNGMESVITSGRLKYDVYGRTEFEYYPIISLSRSQAIDPHQRPAIPAFSNSFELTRPTKFTYDTFDRQTSITNPDNTTTEIMYNISVDHSGVKRFCTITTDANNKVRYSYSDPRGLQTEVKFLLNGNEIRTTFEYNAMGELLNSVDPNNFETAYEYDMLGRNTKRIHPDAGIDIYEYDRASNLISHKTQKLINENSQIDYIYNYNRLEEVRYPYNPENNIKYKYGLNIALAANRGKITEIEDATGWSAFSYGRLGEVIKHVRTIVLPNESEPYTFTTTFKYDMWNRIVSIVYPDSETVYYYYDRGGNLKTVTGVKGGITYNYVDKILYDRYGNKSYVYYGNNTYSRYLYNVMLRLDNLTTYVNGGNRVQNIKYFYDAAGNITKIENTANMHSTGLGGKYTNTYEYDDLYRLHSSKGEFTGDNIFIENYLSMAYENNGRIKNMNQSQKRATLSTGSFLISGDNSVYNYNTSQPNTLKSVSRLRPNPSYTFTWDANGNMTKYYTKLMGWDEDNRITTVGDNNYNSFYMYDSKGERTYKLTGERQYLYVNGIGKYYNRLNSPTLYVSPFLVATSTGYTKHIYAGSERIASKIGKGGISYVRQHLKSQTLWLPKQTASRQYMIRSLSEGINRIVEESDITNNSLQNLYLPRSYVEETEQYFYSTDHLGSSSWITNTSGEPIQHLQYLPFGSNYVNQRVSDWNSMYTFSGKERDSETGFGYFGARYYDSGLGIWLSVDPMSGRYPGLSPYVYCADNPVILYDPDGKKIVIKSRDENGKRIKFNYEPGKKYEGNNAFIRKTVESLEYSRTGDDLGIIDKLVQDKRNVKIKESEFWAEYASNNNTIMYNPNYGLEEMDTEGNLTGEKLSPSLILLHELGHAYIDFFKSNKEKFELYKPDTQFYRKDEKWILNYIEHPAARKFGQGKRNYYEDGQYYRTTDPTKIDSFY